MCLGVGKVEKDAKGVDEQGEPEGGGVASVVDGDAAEHDAEPHADVPTGELGGVGGASLVVGGEVDKHGLHTRPNMTVAQTNDEGGTIVANGMLQEGEKEVAEDTDEDAVVDILHHPSLAKRTCPDETGEDEAAAEDGEPRTGASGHVEHFFAVDGEIVGQHAVGHADAHHDDALAPAFQEEEAVEGEGGFVGNNLFCRELHCRIDGASDASCQEGKEEDKGVVADGIVDEQSDGGGNAGGKVVGQPIIADSLGSAGGMEHVDGRGAVGNGDCPHRCSVQGADDGEEGHRACNEIAGKEGEEEEVTGEQHHTTGITIDEKTCKGTCQEGSQSIARQDDADGVFVCLVGLAEIEGKQRRDEHEGEEYHEVGRPDFRVVGIPEFFFHRMMLMPSASTLVTVGSI